MYNSGLIRRIQEKKFSYVTRDLIQINCLGVSNSNHYTRMFSVLVSGCNWILIHLIGQKSLHFEKKNN